MSSTSVGTSTRLGDGIFDGPFLERSGFWIGFGEQVVVHDQSYSQPESTPNSESRPKTNVV